MKASFKPGDAAEEFLAAGIVSAAWRLRRCNLADADVAAHSTVDPLLDATQKKQIRSIERARAHSNSVFHCGLNQLRKLPKEGLARGVQPDDTPDLKPDPVPEPAPEDSGRRIPEQSQPAPELDHELPGTRPGRDGPPIRGTESNGGQTGASGFVL